VPDLVTPASTPVRVRPPAVSLGLRRRLPILGFILPAVVYLALFMGYPMIYLVHHSLLRENYANPGEGSKFIGLGNYSTVLHSSLFWQSVLVTAVFATLAVSLELGLGLGIALLLQKTLAGRRVLIALFLIPSMMMPIAVGLMWRYMLDDGYGMVSYYLKLVHVLGPGGLITHPLFARPWSALGALVLADVWEWTPFMALIILAGLESLPIEPYEAAAVDGANRWQEFWQITLPLLNRAIVVALLIRIADAMRVLDIVFAITGGGPGNSTMTAQLLTYNIGFGAFQTGLAFAQVILVLSATVVACALIFTRVSREGAAA
jgi:multiple sugar transport system permease protein